MENEYQKQLFFPVQKTKLNQNTLHWFNNLQ